MSDTTLHSHLPLFARIISKGASVDPALSLVQARVMVEELVRVLIEKRSGCGPWVSYVSPQALLSRAKELEVLPVPQESQVARVLGLTMSEGTVEVADGDPDPKVVLDSAASFLLWYSDLLWGKGVRIPKEDWPDDDRSVAVHVDSDVFEKAVRSVAGLTDDTQLLFEWSEIDGEESTAGANMELTWILAPLAPGANQVVFYRDWGWSDGRDRVWHGWLDRLDAKLGNLATLVDPVRKRLRLRFISVTEPESIVRGLGNRPTKGRYLLLYWNWIIK